MANNKIVNDISLDNKNEDVEMPDGKDKKNESIVLDKYRNMEMLQYLYYNNFTVKNEGVRKKIKFGIYNFTINTSNNLFIDNNNSKIYGRGLLNLVIYLYKYNIIEAVNHINKFLEKRNYFFSFPSGNNSLSSEMPFSNFSDGNLLIMDKNKDKKYKSIPVENNDKIDSIRNYLVYKRCINKDIIDHCIDNKLIYSDDKCNCIFTNEDRTFALAKGIRDIKFNQCSGIPDFIRYGPTNHIIYLFESPIDALSFFDLYRDVIEGSLLSTNGSMMVNNIINYIKEYNIKKIYSCFDNDKKGNQYHNIMCDQIKENKFEILIYRKIPNKYKDFNEYLCYQTEKRKNNFYPVD